MIYTVYILHCADGSYYTGFTNDMERRMEEHHTGHSPTGYTTPRRPVTLVHTETYSIATVAIDREKQIKRWTRRKKIALINGHNESLKKLAKRKGRS